MKYVPPVGGAADDPHVTGNRVAGVEGTEVPGEAIEHPQREIVHVIKQAGLKPSGTVLTQLHQAILALCPGVPASTIIWVPLLTAPSGYFKANGAAVSRTAYADLFTAIGTTFGVGDGSTIFNLPDLRGEFVRGWDNGRGIDSGRVLGSSQTDEFKAHVHKYGHPHSSAYGMTITTYPGVRPGNNTGYTTAATGGTETRPRNIALLACIKY